MLAQAEAGAPLPRWVVVELAQATGTVLAEAEAAGRAVLTSAIWTVQDAVYGSRRVSAAP
jgi:hypothetical protein